MARVLLTVLLLIAGCAMTESTMTQSQATGRVEQLIRETAAALTPRPRLELIPYSVPVNMCLDKSPEHVIVNRKYWLRDIPAAAHAAISQQVRTYWETRGYTITAAGGPGNPDLSAESRPDHFVLALTWAEGDDLYLAASSPCVRASSV